MIDQKLLQAIIDSDDTQIDRLEYNTKKIRESQDQKELDRGIRLADHILRPYENRFNKGGKENA